MAMDDVQEVLEENGTTEVILDDVIEDAGMDIENLEPASSEQISKPVTYKGNAYDMTSLIALLSGVGILFLCLTCNMGFYLLPFVAIVLGVFGVVQAQKSVDPQRTQLLSWLGIGSGIAVILISLFGIAVYIMLIILIARTTRYSQF
jgi:hypothetical protein